MELGFEMSFGLLQRYRNGVRTNFRRRMAWAQQWVSGLWIAAAVVGLAATAQEPRLKVRTKEQRDREYMAKHRVTLNVQVADASGKPVADLHPGDFTLLDNNQPRKIASFHEIDGERMSDATEVVIVLDAVNSPATELEAERQGIFNYLASKHGPLPYPTSFALWWNGQMTTVPATIDRNEVGKAFVKLTKKMRSNACAAMDEAAAHAVTAAAGAAKTSGGNDGSIADRQHCLEGHFRDSIAALDSIAAQQRHVGGRTLLIWVGRGWPQLPDAEFQRRSPKAQQSLFEEFVNLTRNLRDSQVTVDVISAGDGTHEAEMARADSAASAPDTTSAQGAVPALPLPIVARQTGGQVHARSSDIAADLAECIHDADGYYAISFVGDPASSGAPELHSIEVKVNRAEAKVRTMTTYYAVR